MEFKLRSILCRQVCLQIRNRASGREQETYSLRRKAIQYGATRSDETEGKILTIFIVVSHGADSINVNKTTYPPFGELTATLTKSRS